MCLLMAIGEAGAEQGILVVHVRDVKDRPLAGVEIATEGDGGKGTSDPVGKVRIRLAPQTLPGQRVTLQIVTAPGKRDLVFISPWDRITQVPPFDNESNNYVPTVVADRADQDLLRDSRAARAMAANINKANTPQGIGGARGGGETEDERRQRSLREVAQYYGFAAADVDAAIREWGRKTTDPYEVGLAALYERDYPRAAKQLSDSLEMRKKEEAKAQQAAEQAQAKTADAAFFLGQAMYEQGRYREAVTAYREAAARRGDDAVTVNALAVSLYQAADYAGAEPLYRRALALSEKALGPGHADVGAYLNNLALLLYNKGDYTGAEPLYRRALAIDEKALGPEHPHVATDLNNLALLLQAQGDYTGAEPLFRRALGIWEKALGPEHPDVARGLNNLAMLLKVKGDYTGAEPLFRRALAINEKAFGPNHPTTRTIQQNLDSNLAAQAKHDKK
jgi:tetratricopeptide (TPR) repeat protein